jgi:Flp pilus assembly protein TadB
MTPDQQAGSDSERQDARGDDREAEADAEREEARDEGEGREGAGDDEGERGLRDDVKELPGAMREDARRLYRGADESIAQRMEEKPVFERALDLRIVLASLVIAFVLALVLRLIGLSPLFCIVIFLIALGGLWFGLARFYSARRPRHESRESEDDEGADDGEEAG